MSMPCRITDEQVYNPWEDCGIESPLRKSLEEVTLHDLMGEDHYVWISRNRGYGYLMEIENHESTEPYLREVGINKAAMESLALFCRRFIGLYDKISEE